MGDTLSIGSDRINGVSGVIDVGFTVPAQAWTYWHLGPGTGPDYLDDQRGHDWSDQQARTAAGNRSPDR